MAWTAAWDVAKAVTITMERFGRMPRRGMRSSRCHCRAARQSNAEPCRHSWLPLPACLELQGDDIRELSEAPGFQLPGELREDVEATGLRCSVESAGERHLDLVCAGFLGGRIAPRLPHARVNT